MIELQLQLVDPLLATDTVAATSDWYVQYRGAYHVKVGQMLRLASVVWQSVCVEVRDCLYCRDIPELGVKLATLAPRISVMATSSLYT